MALRSYTVSAWVQNVHERRIYIVDPGILYSNMTKGSKGEIRIMKVLGPASLVIVHLPVREAERIPGDDIASKSRKSIRDLEYRADIFEFRHALKHYIAFFLYNGLLVDDNPPREAMEK